MCTSSTYFKTSHKVCNIIYDRYDDVKMLVWSESYSCIARGTSVTRGGQCDAFAIAAVATTSGHKLEKMQMVIYATINMFPYGHLQFSEELCGLDNNCTILVYIQRLLWYTVFCTAHTTGPDYAMGPDMKPVGLGGWEVESWWTR